MSAAEDTTIKIRQQLITTDHVVELTRYFQQHIGLDPTGFFTDETREELDFSRAYRLEREQLRAKAELEREQRAAADTVNERAAGSEASFIAEAAEAERIAAESAPWDQDSIPSDDSNPSANPAR